jgi:hypothetical protein
MQGSTKVEHREWQDSTLFPRYAFGECPRCAGVGEEYDSGLIDDDTKWHEFACPDCGRVYMYQSRFVYRYDRVVPEDEEAKA